MEERKCTLCPADVVEDLFHLVMQCEHYADLRQGMLDKIKLGVTYQSWCHIETLPPRILYYILIGMCYPVSYGDLWIMRTISCQSIRKIYMRRINL